MHIDHGCPVSCAVRKRRQPDHRRHTETAVKIHRTQHPSSGPGSPRHHHMTSTTAMLPTGCVAQEPLSVFNQCSPRGYICIVLCFPCLDNQRETAAEHLRASVKELAKEHPLFAGRLQNSSQGKVVIKRSPLYDIPFDVRDAEDKEMEDYEKLKNAGFPPGMFIRPRYGIPGLVDSKSTSLPVSKVDVTFIHGGLFLSIFLQHAITDGGSLRVFLEAFGNKTRNMSTRSLPSEQRLRFPKLKLQKIGGPKQPLDDCETVFKRLVASCPEYATLPDLSGPTQPRMQEKGLPIPDIKRVGKIFVFTTERLQELRELMQRLNGPESNLPTAYMSLATLIFAHVTKARSETEPQLTGIEAAPTASLWNSVNWRPRAFLGATTNYFGNAVLPVVTRASREEVGAACDDDGRLAQLMPVVKKSIDVVDEEYVRLRMAMMSQAPDPRMVGVNYDPRSPESLCVNTWRHFGADVEWHIPGVPTTKPDSIRRAMGGWGLGTALILPARADSDRQELFVSLSVEAMDALCKDERWMRWVDRVIG
ncbi:hypothetical protein F5Y17DRAFT_347860 [Xylariaceae sp. FL0594]|nr:hypothetical protein F5Y17DRAFT_347860 [Xylariaceae sp. FL0594]